MTEFPGVKGTTFGLDIRDNIVYISEIQITKNSVETQLFLYAYRMGRDHKKMEIRNALSL
jgi:hypothetical protein